LRILSAAELLIPPRRIEVAQTALLDVGAVVTLDQHHVFGTRLGGIRRWCNALLPRASEELAFVGGRADRCRGPARRGFGKLHPKLQRRTWQVQVGLASKPRESQCRKQSGELSEAHAESAPFGESERWSSGL